MIKYIYVCVCVCVCVRVSYINLIKFLKIYVIKDAKKTKPYYSNFKATQFVRTIDCV